MHIHLLPDRIHFYWIVLEIEWHRYRLYYFIVSGEINVYLMKIKVVSITSELISYHFTSD